MRSPILSLAWALASGVGAPACADPDAGVGVEPAATPARSAETSIAAPARSAVAASGPGPGARRDGVVLHVVAMRRGRLALEVDEAMELLRASVEIVELVDDGPLVRDPIALAGLREFLGGWSPRSVRSVRFAARWPHFAMLSAEVGPDHHDIDARGALWDGARWRRDDAMVGALRRVHTPIGPDALGTLLTRVDVYDERRSDPDDPRLVRARPKTLVRRMPDGSRHTGPREPSPRLSRWAALASSTSGHVFAADETLSVWSPDHGAWTTTDLPGREATPWGFRVFAPDDVLAMGGFTEGPWMAHYDGARWNAVEPPPCLNAIVRVARHDHRLWVLCSSDRAMPVSTDVPKWLWVGDGTGRWTPMGVTRRADAPHVVDVIERAEERRLEGFAASDLASTTSGTLWMVAGEFGSDGHATSEQRWLLRAGAPASLLELPSDRELADALPP
jgi:hypothetical protein